MMHQEEQPPVVPQECPSQMPVSYFGANYQDSVCIEGYLWDEDSGDMDEGLSSGGDIPCPFCKPKEHMEYQGSDEMLLSCTVCQGSLSEYHWAETDKPSVRLYGHCSECGCNRWAKATPLED